MAEQYRLAVEALRIARKASAYCYDHSQARTAIERAVSDWLAPAYANLPRQLEHCTPELLGAEGTTYLRVDTGGPKGGFTNGARLILTRIEFHGLPLDGRARDLDTGDDLGEVNRWSFTRKDEPDWMIYGDQTKRRIWREPRYAKFMPRHRTFAALLPLSGPILRHDAFARLAEHASAVWSGTAPAFVAMVAHDAEMDRLCAAMESAREEARWLALGSADVEALAARHPDLAKDLRTMDWTYQYADRPDRAYGEQELRIRAALKQLSLDDATALFVGLSLSDWDSFSNYLMLHPEVIALSAPERLAA